MDSVVYQFEAVLKRPDGVGTWTYLDIPFDLVAISGLKGQMKVKGAINGLAFRTSAIPHGDGRHYIVINKVIRESISKSQGDMVAITMELDADEHSLTLPLDFIRALKSRPDAEIAFNALSYSYQKEYIAWIDDVRKDTTRQRRIEKAMQMLEAGESLKKKPQKPGL